VSTAEPAAAHPRRRTFGPVVLRGLAGAGLGAVSASNTWVTGSGSSTEGVSALVVAQGQYGRSPLAAAVALVVLACWGVVLVTRGRFRRGVTVLGVVAALAFAVTTALAPSQLRDSLVEQLRTAGVANPDPDTSLTGWWWAAVLAAVVVVATSAAALAWVRHWPEMGTRYDAPADAADGTGRGDRSAPESNLDMWKALDEGRDPTEEPTP
jgi:uncharacterized membrane protein (TIGR02234 family)